MLGEFQTLVNPGCAIPPFITVLTGITQAMVAAAPRIEAVLPGFLEFARGAVLVAHNAPFDVGFLKAACARARHRLADPRLRRHRRLARRVLTRDEVPNCKLATLAAVLPRRHPAHPPGARRRPGHRRRAARADRAARAAGRHTLEELTGLTRQVTPTQRRKRHLADGLPARPGRLHLPRPARRAALRRHVRRPRSRVRSYFTAGEQRSRISEMVGAAERVDAIECAHALEAEVRELRLIAAHEPPYNRRSKFPERALWLKLTDEPFPRLSVVRRRPPGHRRVPRPVPRPARRRAAVAAVHDALPLRQCTTGSRLRVRGTRLRAGRLGRCGAPCTGAQRSTSTPPSPRSFRAAVDRRPAPRWSRRCSPGSTGWPPRSATRRRRWCATGSPRCVRAVRAHAAAGRADRRPELVAARPDGAGGWELSVVRRGRLAAAGGAAARRRRCAPTLAALLATAETPTGPDDELAASSTRPSDPALAGEAGHPAGRARPAPWPAPRRAPAPSRVPGPGRGRPGRRDPFADGRSLGTRARPDGCGGCGRTAARPARIAGVITAIVMIDAATD